MKRSVFLRTGAGVAFGLAWPAFGVAQTERGFELTLRDRLDDAVFAWPRTLLSAEVDLSRIPRLLNQPLALTDSTGGQVPFQISGSTLHWFSDLPAGAVRTLRLAASSGEPAPSDGVRSYREGDTIVVDAQRLRVRLPASRRVNGSSAPGPLLGIDRGRGWIGTSTLRAAREHIVDLETECLEAGPAFARYCVAYRFASGAQYKMTLRIISGYDHVELFDECTGLSVESQASLDMAWTNFHPTHRFSSTWPNLQDGFRKIDDPIVVDYRGEDPPFFGQPGIERPSEEFAYRLGPYAPAVAFKTYPQATFWDETGGESLGVFVREHDRWNDGEYAIWTSGATLQVRFRYAQGVLHWNWPLAAGTRSTAISYYDHAEDLRVLREQRYVTTYNCGLALWYADLDLDRVKSWKLDAPDSSKRPVLFRDGTIQSVDELLAHLRNDERRIDTIAHGINTVGGKTMLDERSFFDLYVDGYDRLRSQMTPEQRAYVEAQFLINAYVCDGEQIGPMRHMLGGHPNFMADGRSILGGAAYLFPNHPQASQWADHFEAYVRLSGLYHTRPHVPRMQAQGGRWTESPGAYVWAYLRPIMRANFLAQQRDGRNRCATPWLAANAAWIAGALSAPVMLEGRMQRIMPEQGAHAYRLPLPLEAWLLASALRRYSPLVAEHLRWAATPSGHLFEALDGAQRAWAPLLADVHDSSGGTNPHLSSAKYTGYGVILRAAVDAPDEISVHLQQIDRGPNYRWGIQAEGGCGDIYYYAAGRIYSGHGTEDAGDRRNVDAELTTNFAVFKDGTWRSIGMNDLTRPLYDLGVAQFAQIVPRQNSGRDYAWPEYRSRSVLLVGSDYIVTYDAIDDGVQARFSWFTHLDDDLPFIALVKGMNERIFTSDVTTNASRGRQYETHDALGDCLTVVSHRKDLRVDPGKSTPFGAIVRGPQSIDYIFRTEPEIDVARDGIRFRGTAGIVRRFGSTETEVTIFHGQSIATPELAIAVDHGEFGISASYGADAWSCSGKTFGEHGAMVTMRFREAAPGPVRFYVDGVDADAHVDEHEIIARLPAGAHRWEITGGAAQPNAPEILRSENRSGGCVVVLAPVPDADGYRFELSADGGITWSPLGTSRNTRFELAGQRNGTKIHIRAIARNRGRESVPGHEYPVYVSDAPPLPPDGLACEISHEEVTLSWGEVLGASTYRLYRRKRGGSAWSLVANARTLRFVDRKAFAEAIYEYTVAAVDGNGEGPKSVPIDTDPTSWRNWRPAGPRRFRRRTAYLEPPYTPADFIPPDTYEGQCEIDDPTEPA